MSTLPAVDAGYLQDILVELLNTPSPSGYTERIIARLEQMLSVYPGLYCQQTRKGALTVEWPGEKTGNWRALAAHVDTLGAMVKEIKANGRLRLTRVGGYAWNTVEGEGLTVFPHQGEPVSGSLLITKASSHVHSSQVAELKRDEENMEVRLDARTASEEETRALGIEVGDFVAFNPRVETQNGFIRSRHLDDKAGVACLIAAVKCLADAGLKPAQTSSLFFSNFEEVGHGAATGIPAQAEELLVVDMAAVGEGQTSDEFHATICVKDSSGPYHHGFSQRLRRIAQVHELPYKVDIYPYYASDGTAFLHAGGDVATALIGPGIDASHNYERTHMEALMATTRWIVAYLLE